MRLTTAHECWSFSLCFLYLRNTKGCGWNHQRAYRVYLELELNLCIKLKRRIKRDKPEALSVPEAINQVWPMDFMNDTLIDGRCFRTFNALLLNLKTGAPDRAKRNRLYLMYKRSSLSDWQGCQAGHRAPGMVACCTSAEFKNWRARQDSNL